MAARNKLDLLKVTRKEYDKLAQLISSIDFEQAVARRDDDASIKEIIGHRAHWIDLFLGWYADGLAGGPVFFPAEGYKWNDLKRYNSDLRSRQIDLNWGAAQALLNTNYRKLISFIEKASTEELYGGPMKGANNQWTPGRWAEAAGPSHFRSASKYIRCVLKASA